MINFNTSNVYCLFETLIRQIRLDQIASESSETEVRHNISSAVMMIFTIISVYLGPKISARILSYELS